jgi:Ca-activated chloride channel family protein
MIEWLSPWVFYLLPLPLLAWRLLPAATRPSAALRVPDATMFDAPTGAVTLRSARWPLLLAVLAWFALIAAAARPQLTGDPVSLPTSGRDLMLAVDISGSMNTEDMILDGRVVDRLTMVKAVVRDFIARRAGDRVGLVLFGSNAYLQSPLTFDLRTLATLLNEAPVGIAGGKTAIGDAIGLAVKRLRDRPADSRVVILLTDGANNVGEVAPAKAAELAAAAGVRIYTIGVGADEMRVPGFFRERIVNPSADLDEATLQQIARTAGGRYFRARNTEELAEIYAVIDGFEPVAQEARTFRPVKALFYWPLTVSLLILVILMLATARRSSHVAA